MHLPSAYMLIVSQGLYKVLETNSV